ncbi:MAG: response regulator transcription factor, partial [Dongiaceae bacterium]
MIVDDDAHIQLALRQIVESAGHSAIEASNGQDAIEMFEEYRPDVVITDIFMPQTDGIETIRAIRRCKPDARIIA